MTQKIIFGAVISVLVLSLAMSWSEYFGYSMAVRDFKSICFEPNGSYLEKECSNAFFK